MLEKIKLALRISHNALDAVIEGEIEAAKSDMIRAGVDPSLANDSTSPLVIQCVTSYVLWLHADANTNSSRRMQEVYEHQLDNLRKSSEVI